MSKTKEEILQHHYIHDHGLVNRVLYVHNAMDTFADQKLDEYKERLKKELATWSLTEDQEIIWELIKSVK